MTAFNEHQFEKRLQALKDSQESIMSLSSWCLQHRQHHKKIVACWLRVLKKVKIEHRLTLFYLANDVIQYSKRKNYEFVESWGTAIQRATTMVREDKVKHRVLRIFKIWDERGIYDEAFISDLSGLLSTNTKKTNNEAVHDASDFQPPTLIAKIRSCKKLEDDTDLKLKRLNESHLSFTDIDALRSHLKGYRNVTDRRQGDDLVAEVDEGVAKMTGFVAALELEIKERNALIEQLEQAENFYEIQKGEAKVVANAYRNFGSRVKTLKRRLDELIPTLKEVSPIPSPDINAPSPSPDSDIDLPEENDNTGSVGDSFFSSYSTKANPIKTVLQDESHHQSMDNCFSSFMGNTSLAFDIQKSLFNDTSIDTPASPPPMAMDDSVGVPLLNTDLEPVPEPEHVSEGKPIEVISSRTKSEEQFNITEFLKSLIPSGGSPSIPGLNMDPPPQDALSPSISKTLYNSSPDINPASAYDYPEEPSQTPLQPPPMPPNLFPLEDTSYKYDQPVEREEDAWNTKLPPKFPTWGDTATGWEREEPEKTSEWTPVLPPNKVVPPMPPITLDTPESPPMYEKEGFSDPVEYDDSVVDPPLMSSSGDVDHRTLVHLPVNNHTKDSDCRIPLPVKVIADTDHRVILPLTPTNHSKKDMDHRTMLSRKKDVDHRNLISLTGSPVRDHSILPPPPTPPTLNWSHSDQDYRTNIPPPPLPHKKELMHQGDQDYRLHPPHLGRRQLEESQDNVESVDMEMSDEEMTESAGMDDMPHMMHEKKSMMDKDRDYDMCNKPVISFNINSNAKILTNSPLNEVKDDMSRPKNRVYGCQKIPTISGIGGNMHPPRGMGPLRPRIPILTPPPGIKRLPPPGLPRGFRPSMMSTPPPPLPPFPPHMLQPPPERFNVTIEIKPQAEIESQRKAEELAARKDFAPQEQARKQPQLLPPLPPPPEIPKTTPPIEKEIKQEVNESKDWIKKIVPPKTLSEVKMNNSDVANSNTEELKDDSTIEVKNEVVEEKVKEEEGAVEVTVKKKEEEEEMEEEVQTVVIPEIVPKPEIVKQIINPFDIPGSEHWMNNELIELEQMEMACSMDTTNNSTMGNTLTNTMGSPPGKSMGRGQGGRGRPFKNFQRGGFMPRARPMWNGPRRGGPPRPPPPPPPPGRFPFRPPLERPFGRGHRGGGGFRPFRGNRGGHFGGW